MKNRSNPLRDLIVLISVLGIVSGIKYWLGTAKEGEDFITLAKDEPTPKTKSWAIRKGFHQGYKIGFNKGYVKGKRSQIKEMNATCETCIHKIDKETLNSLIFDAIDKYKDSLTGYKPENEEYKDFKQVCEELATKVKEEVKL